MPEPIDVISAGHLCLDITPQIPESGRQTIGDFFCPGVLINVNSAAVALGGVVANTGLALQHFGLALAPMASIGDDDFGALVLRQLERHGVAAAIRPTAGRQTSYSVVIAPPHIDRMFMHFPGANDLFGAEDIDFERVAQARLMHLGYPPLMRRLYENEGAELETILRRAKQAGVTTSLDMALPDSSSPAGRAPWDRILAAALPHVDLFLPSIEEIFYMLAREEYAALKAQHPQEDFVELVPVATFQRLAEQALALGCGACVIKAGRRGFYLRTGSADRLGLFGARAALDAAAWAGRELWRPAFKLNFQIASATGSGDVAIAGFLTAALRGAAPERALALACAAGFHNLRAVDALSGVPPWADLESFVDTYQTYEDPALAGSGFTEQAAGAFWSGPRDRA